MAIFVLILLGWLCELVAALTGFDFLIHANHYFGWLSLGLFFFLSAILLTIAVGAPGPIMARRQA